MSVTVYIPCDSAAIGLGAERVAKAIAAEAVKRNVDINLIRNGSRGLYYLEPMIEVDTDKGRMAYGSVQVSDVKNLFDAGFLTGGSHSKSLGLTEEIPYLKNSSD